MVLLALVTIIAIPLTLIFLPLRKLFSEQSDAVDPEILREFENAVEVMKSGDRVALEALAADLDGFPQGKDRFIGRTWLTNALGEGAPPDTIRWMVERGVNLNYFDDEGFSPLQTASGREDDAAPEILQVLIDAGADVNAKGNLDITALHTAAANGSQAVVLCLLENGADAGATTTDATPAQPAAWAEDAGRDEIARILRDRMAASPED